MSNEILNSLLKEYEQKKLNAEIDLDRRKQNLYKLIPRLEEIDNELNMFATRLEEIDNELNMFAITTTKNILNKTSNSMDIINLNNKISELKKEKELILIKNNYSIDYLKPFYECKLCNDTGYVLDENYKTKMCSCLKQKLLNISFNKSNMSNLNKENFNNFNELIFSDEVDLAKYRFNISPRKNILNIKNKSIEFINNFDNPDYNNLLFVGSTGLR